MPHEEITNSWSAGEMLATAEIFQPVSGDVWISTESGSTDDGPEGIFLPYLSPLPLNSGQTVRWRAVDGEATLARMSVL